MATRGLDEFDHVVDAVDTATLVLREADASVTERVDHARIRFAAEQALSTNASDAPFSLEVGGSHEPDGELARVVSELRLVKDEFEQAQMRAAIAATERGFTEVIAELPRITSEVRGERVIEGVFATRARLEGNDVGYGSIAAAGPHATVLHWTRNDGPVVPGDLVLLDAGVELDSYYTADITRTFPVSGTYSAVQRQVYEAVLEAADAAFAIVKPGVVFREVHAAAMQVIARKTAEWGFLPVSAEASLEPENQFHRRYMVHGTSHHLGLDVHDCAQARRDMYMDGELEAGMVFTIEPGLYFQPDDLTVPEEFRGIGVRIEDDILVTADGAENLSAGIPRTADEVEAWVRGASRAERRLRSARTSSDGSVTGVAPLTCGASRGVLRLAVGETPRLVVGDLAAQGVGCRGLGVTRRPIGRLGDRRARGRRSGRGRRSRRDGTAVDGTSVVPSTWRALVT